MNTLGFYGEPVSVSLVADKLDRVDLASLRLTSLTDRLSKYLSKDVFKETPFLDALKSSSPPSISDYQYRMPERKPPMSEGDIFREHVRKAIEKSKNEHKAMGELLKEGALHTSNIINSRLADDYDLSKMFDGLPKIEFPQPEPKPKLAAFNIGDMVEGPWGFQRPSENLTKLSVIFDAMSLSDPLLQSRAVIAGEVAEMDETERFRDMVRSAIERAKSEGVGR